MMKEEDQEDIDLTLSSEMSDISLTGSFPSNISSKASSVIGEMTGKLEEEDLLDDLGPSKSSTSTPSHSVSKPQNLNSGSSMTECEPGKSELKSVDGSQTQIEPCPLRSDVQASAAGLFGENIQLQTTQTAGSAKNLFGDSVDTSDSFGKLLINNEKSALTSSFGALASDKSSKKNHSNITFASSSHNAIVQQNPLQSFNRSNISMDHTRTPVLQAQNIPYENPSLKETSYFHVAEGQQNFPHKEVIPNTSSSFESNQTIFSYTGPIPSTSVQGSSISNQQFHPQTLGQFNGQNVSGSSLQQSQSDQPFIPSMYNYGSGGSYENANLFIPANPSNTEQNKTYMPPYNNNNTHTSVMPAEPYQSTTNGNVTNYLQTNSWEVVGGNGEKLDQDEPSIWDWMKNTDWAEGAQKLGKQLLEKTKITVSPRTLKQFLVDLFQTATDTVLTTLDPGMEEYLRPVINIAVASQNDGIVQGFKHGFRGIFGHAAVKGQYTAHAHARLPIGFDAGVKATVEMLNNLTPIKFDFNGSYITVATEVFLTELEQGRWSAMFCLGLRDLHRNLELHSFSQPIPLPLECVTVAYQKTPPEQVQQLSGYSITIDEAVRLYKPYTGDEDWCFALTGIRIQTILTLASQCLAADYKMQINNPRLNQVESLVVM